MVKDRIRSRVMAGVAIGGAALLMTSPSATAVEPGYPIGHSPEPECFVTGTLTVPDLAVEVVGGTISFNELAAEAEIYVNLSCSSPQPDRPFARVLLDGDDGDVLVGLEPSYPDSDTAFRHVLGHRHAGWGHHDRDDLHFVYEGTATLTFETDDTVELETDLDLLLAQDTVPVKADGTTGSLLVQGVLVQGELAGAA